MTLELLVAFQTEISHYFFFLGTEWSSKIPAVFDVIIENAKYADSRSKVDQSKEMSFIDFFTRNFDRDYRLLEIGTRMTSYYEDNYADCRSNIYIQSNTWFTRRTYLR